MKTSTPTIQLSRFSPPYISTLQIWTRHQLSSPSLRIGTIFTHDIIVYKNINSPQAYPLKIWR